MVGKSSTSWTGAEGKKEERRQSLIKGAGGRGCGWQCKVVGATGCSSYAPRCMYCCRGSGHVEEQEQADGNRPPFGRHATPQQSGRYESKKDGPRCRNKERRKLWLEFVPNIRRRSKIPGEDEPPADRRQIELSLERHQVLDDPRPMLQPLVGNNGWLRTPVIVVRNIS